MTKEREILRLLVRTILPVAEFLFWAAFLIMLGRFFFPFVVALAIAMVADPAVRYLDRHFDLRRRHGSFFFLALILVLVGGMFYLLGAGIYQLFRAFIAELPRLLTSLQRQLSGAEPGIRHLASLMPDRVGSQVQNLFADLGTAMEGIISGAASPTVEAAGSVARKIPGGIIYFVVILIASYQFLTNFDRVTEWFHRYAPSRLQEYLGYIRADMTGVIGAYFKAQFKIMFVVAVVLAAAFWLLHIAYGPLLALLIALLDFLPILGTGTILAPWAILVLLQGNWILTAELLGLWLLTQLVRQLIQPKIMGDSMGIPPMASLVLLYVGYRLMGLAGMILAIPAGLLLYRLYCHGAFQESVEYAQLLRRALHSWRYPDDVGEAEAEADRQIEESRKE